MDKQVLREPVLNVSRVEFDLFGNDEVAKYSVVDIMHSDTYDNSSPKPGGLIDPRMGVTDQFMTCATCKENFLECPGHFGHSRLSEPVFHWGFMTFVKNVLSCVCLKSCKLLVPTVDIRTRLIARGRWARFNEIRSICAAVKVSPYSGIPVPKITVDVKKHSGLIHLTAEYTVASANEAMLSELAGGAGTTVETINDNKKKIKQVLTAETCLYILRNISPGDCELLGIRRPADMIIHNFPIPPVAIRPSIKGDFLSQGYSEHGTTHKLSDIIKFNNKLSKEKERSLTVADNQRYIETYQQCLQYHCATYFDNESMSLPRCELKSGSGNAARSITFRFKGGKTGRIRGNLQGKRVDFSARTVITSDPSNDLDELGVPVKIAKTVTFPEIVTPFNIGHLTELVKRGKDRYPGANFIENPHVLGPNGKPIRIDLRYRNRNTHIRYGWVVHRHLRDGDIVLFNRQPSLHKMSMMAHRVRIIDDPSLITFRMNVTATEPYNADFDGDEMNLFAPQSEQAREELRRLADIKNHIISPKDSQPIVSLKQDARLGSFTFTQPDYTLSWRDAMSLLSQTSCRKQLMDGNIKIGKNQQYLGKDIMSMIIPGKVNIDSGKTLIKNGVIVSGILGKGEIGEAKNSIPHLITDSYSKHRAARFMDDVQRITNTWLMLYGGFTVGLGDMVISKEVTEQVKANVQQKLLDVCNLLTETENNHMIDRPHFEEFVFRELSAVLSTQIKTLRPHLGIDNSLHVMIESGSKGKWQNVGLIMGCLGQNPFEGKLMPKRLNHRSLPYFPKHDDLPDSRGFISRCYLEGINPVEFFFNMTDGRNGMIDTAIKTADTGYMQRRTIKATEDVHVANDLTVRNSNGGIIQLIYGDSGYDTSKQMEVKSSLILMDNKTVEETFGFSAEERKRYGISEEANRQLVDKALRDRDKLRVFQEKALMNPKVVEELYNLPFHVVRMVQYHSGRAVQGEKLKVQVVVDALQNMFSPRTTWLMCMRDQDSFKKRVEGLSKSLFRILVREQLSPKRLIVDYRMNAAQFKALMDEVSVAYNRNIVQPNEMVGILAAQSICEPLTQFTLNTFHQSGMADMGNLSPIARFKELISFSKNVKKPLMRIYLEKHLSTDKKTANTLLNSVQNTMFEDLVTRSTVTWDAEGKVAVPEDIRAVFHVTGPYINDITLLGAMAPFVFHFEMDPMAMLKRQVDLLSIKLRLAEVWEELLWDQKGFKKKEKDVISSVNALYVMSSKENEESLWVDIRVDFKEYSMTKISDMVSLLKTRFRIKGIPGVLKAVCKEELKKGFDEETGALVEYKEHVITVEATTGLTMQKILVLPGIDIKRTTTNDIYTIHRLLGIEAARAALVREITGVFSSGGHSVNHQHITILVDIMTNTGIVTAVNRYGLAKRSDESDPLSRASFEKTVDQLIQAAIFQEVDKVQSISSRVMLGRAFNGGTGAVGLLPDIQKIEKTEYAENRFLVEVEEGAQLPPIQRDPYITEVFARLSDT